MSDTRGKAIIKPASFGFCPESQLANAIIIALPLVSLIAIAFSHYEHNDIEKTILFTKSILVAVPVSYLFFLPFFFAKSFNMNFFLIYGTGLGFLVVGFFIHKYITNFL